jgi:hypothetical protein
MNNEAWIVRVDESITATSYGKGSSNPLTISLKKSEAITTGDTLFLAIENRPDQNAGIFAVAKVVDKRGDQITVHIDQTKLKGGKREFINESAIVREDMFKSWDIGEMPAMQPVRLNRQVALRLDFLSSKTGKDYTRADSMRCLLAYLECKELKIGFEGNRVINQVAFETGRLVRSVSAKIYNFKSLDPADLEDGLDGASILDREIWDIYFNANKEAVDEVRLRDDLVNEEFHDVSIFLPGDGLDLPFAYFAVNDGDDLQLSARRVRRGQAQLRRNLKVIYKNSCAVTGTNEESVLEACHIKAHAETGDNSIENGLLLRSDIHILFDDRLITLDDDCMTIRLCPLVTCPDYTILNNKKTSRRNRIEDRHREIIAARNSQIDWVRNNRRN